MAPSRTGTPRTATPKGSPKPATPKTATPTGSTLGAASLGITGSKPPTRTGTALRTGVSTSGMSPIDALRHTLIKKMREKFGEAAKDVTSQETIANEITAFMANGGSLQSEDLDKLENRIRSRLAGDTPVKNTRTMQKMQEIRTDDWAKMYKFQHEIGSKQDQMKATARMSNQVTLKDELRNQMDLRHSIEAQEKDEEYLYHLEQMEALKLWEQEEEERKKAKLEIVERLKKDREEQIKDRERRRHLQKEQIEKEDEDMLRHLADLTRKDLEAEEAHKERCRIAQEKFKADNEMNKKLKAEAKAKLDAEDKEYQRLYKEQLDKQEQDRAMLVAKVTDIQSRQAHRATQLPPYKYFVSEEKIQEQFQAHEKYLDEKEQAAIESVKKKNWENKLELDRQVHDKLMRKEAEKQHELSYGKGHIAEAEQARQAEMQRKLALLNKNKTYKMQLQDQMKLDATKKKEALMSEEEKKINRQLLEKVEEYKRLNAVQ
mmetsp:Transcript_28573/g.73335  ORF Transcript_28573/g.73335 Transcript_28573/m.73335 type:complete len:489 (+) Transcript_28573:42-1508(+)